MCCYIEKPQDVIKKYLFAFVDIFIFKLINFSALCVKHFND